MNEYTAFLTMFPGCACVSDMCGGLDRAYVTDCAVDMDKLEMTVSVRFEKMPAPAELASLSGRLKSDYSLHNVEIKADFPNPNPLCRLRADPPPAGHPPGTCLWARP
jgi:hypothetical protein